MNAKEAREIVEAFEKDAGNPNWISNSIRSHEYWTVRGFLEAVEKFKPVVKALEKAGEDIGRSETGKAWDRILLALESYRRDVLGEE